MSIEGVDYSYSHPDPRGLAVAGKRFAARYVGYGGSLKKLSVVEAQALADNGIAIVAHLEGTASWMMGGRQAGIDGMRAALAHAAQLGMPEDRPFYLACDFDCTTAQWPTVRECLQGAASVAGLHRVGVYGGYRTVDWALRDGVVAWAWQTYAWSAGRWHAKAQAQQYRNGVSLVGGTVDLDRAMVLDFGQWMYRNAPTNPGGSMTSIWDEDVIPAPADAPDYATNKTWQAKAALGYTLAQAKAANAGVSALSAALVESKAAATTSNADLAQVLTGIVGQLSQLAGKIDAGGAAPTVDPVALAAALAMNDQFIDRLAAAIMSRPVILSGSGSVTLSGSLSPKA